MTRKSILAVIMLLVISMLVVACSTTPASRFYTLQPLAERNQADTGNGKITLGVSPVEISPYLERTEIVTRISATRVELATYDRWAEPLENLVAATVAENIMRLRPTINAIIRPWPEAKVDYTLEMKVSRFDSDANGETSLIVSWGIVEQQSRDMLTIRKSTIVQPGNAADFDSVSGSMSKALLKLSSEIVNELEIVKTGK
jgi:uncharacterized lipoprotein YmbA